VLTLRAAAPGDEGFLRGLFAGDRSGEFAALGWDEERLRILLEQQYVAQLRQYRETYPEHERLVVELAGRPVGRIDVHRSPREIRVLEISVVPELRSRGLGTRLIAELQEEATGTERPVRLQVARGNPALRLYQRLGFTAVEESEIYLSLEWTGPAIDAAIDAQERTAS
jgi:ribosomal protein S18 acetylase RimI-like enzyme